MPAIGGTSNDPVIASDGQRIAPMLELDAAPREAQLEPSARRRAA